MRPVIEGAIRDYRGASAQELEERTQRFFEEVRHQVRGDALRTLQRHRSEGHACVLLTSSHFLAACVVSHLKLDGAL